MRFLGGIIVVACLTAGWVHGVEVLEDPANTSTNEVGAERLWTSMREAGMIDAEQYRHVLEHGSLPGGMVITNSPVAVECQKDWNRLAEHGVITAPELAAMLFNGDIPGLTEAEEKMFAELAPVYQPDRAKRLGYELRRKHSNVELIRLMHRTQEEYAAQRAYTLARAAELGIPLTIGTPDGNLIELDRFDELDHPVYVGPENLVAADSISSDELWPTVTNRFNLTGSGAVLGMWDAGGVDRDHREFGWWGSRVSQRDRALQNNHATMVAGTMVAAGLRPAARGMAPGAMLYAHDYYDDLTEMEHAALYTDVKISNHSYDEKRGWFFNAENGWWYWLGNPNVDPYEDYKFGLYNNSAQARDNFVHERPWNLPVWSGGNDRGEAPPRDVTEYKLLGGYTSTASRPPDGGTNGFDTIINGKTAKNILLVGAVEDIVGGYSSPTSVVMSSFSCFGPTDDGRIKPDIVANGVGVYSSLRSGINSYPDVYASASGTSMAAPSASGSLGLLQQLHHELYGTNAAPPWASTWKGLVLHTADEAGDHPGPDYRFGWGLMNTLAAAELMAANTNFNSSPHIKQVSLPDGEEIAFPVQTDTSMPLRVTICWTDPPGPLQPNTLDPTNRVLVNDLDLRIIDPAGVTNFPWVLDLFSPTNAAMTGDNVLDNVEQVVVDNTTTGHYSVVVGHKGSLSNGVQAVSILLSGIQPEGVDPDFGISISSNGWPRLEWTGAVGTIFAIEGNSDLRIPSWWTTLPGSTQSTLRVRNEWVDINSNYTGDTRFYRMRQVN